LVKFDPLILFDQNVLDFVGEHKKEAKQVGP